MAKAIFGGFFGGGITGVTPSRGSTQKMIEKTMNIYRECGGDKFDNAKKLNEDLTEGLSPFDGMKIVLHGKLKKTRETIKALRNAGRRFQSHEKLKNDIRKMVKNLEYDLGKIKKYHEKTKTPNLMQKFLKISPQDSKLCEAREEEIRVMELHVQEVKSLAQQRYRQEAQTGGGRSGSSRPEEDTREKKRVKKLLNNDSSSDDSDSDDSEADSDSADPDRVDQEEIQIEGRVEDEGEYDENGELPDDPTKSKLPPLNIQAAVTKVKQNKAELGKILGIFEQKLEVLHEMAEQIGEQLDEQSELIDEAADKVETRKVEMDKLNEKIEKVNAKASKGTRLIVMTCGFICCTMAIIICYFVLLQTGVLSW